MPPASSREVLAQLVGRDPVAAGELARSASITIERLAGSSALRFKNAAVVGNPSVSSSLGHGSTGVRLAETAPSRRVLGANRLERGGPQRVEIAVEVWFVRGFGWRRR